jgi:endogenous inhibitor of DNA gyrase (YacG/DUF329 family)
MRLRAYTYLRGKRVCPECTRPLDGLRRDAVAHPHCAREIRRKRGERLSGTRAAATLGRLAENATGRQIGVSCPECGGDVLMVKVHGWATLNGQDRARRAADFPISGRKVATCLSCEWRGTVARTRVRGAVAV